MSVLEYRYLGRVVHRHRYCY